MKIKIYIIVFASVLCSAAVFGQEDTSTKASYVKGSQYVYPNRDTSRYVIQMPANKSFNQIEDQNIYHLYDKLYVIINSDDFAKIDADYFSYIYLHNDNSNFFVLPRLILKLRKGYNIDNILADFDSILTVKYIGYAFTEDKDTSRYVLSCNVKSSEDIFRLTERLNERKEVVWCIFDCYEEFNTDNEYYTQQH